MRRVLFISLLLLWHLVTLVSLACAEDRRATSGPSRLPVLDQVPLKETQASGPYCGIFSLAVCLEVLGVDAGVDSLWKKEYVGSSDGSTAAELMEAARDFGCYAVAYRNLTHRELALATSPMILHVRTNWRGAEYSHWVAFLGFRGDRLEIVDPPFPLEAYSPAELLANWDGLAIAISRHPQHAAELTGGRLQFALFVCAFGLIVQLCKSIADIPFGRRPIRLLGRPVLSQMVVILSLSLVLAIIFHSCSPIGFYRNSAAASDVSARYNSTTVPDITLAELRAATSDPATILIDARRRASYERGTILNARNVPENSSLPAREEVLNGVSRSARVIIFCQSSNCPYADRIARFLRFNGYSNLAIYRNGYWEWSREPLQLQQKGAG